MSKAPSKNPERDRAPDGDRASDWRRLEELLKKARGKPSRLSVEELQELERLYGRATADLSYARTRGGPEETLQYLNRLVARAHSLVYRRPKGRAGTVLRFYAAEFPGVFRRTLPYVLLSALILFGSGLGAYISVRADERNAYRLVPAACLVAPEEWEERAAGTREVPQIFPPMLASLIVSNNVQVTFFAFALGITCGAGTAYIMLTNGLLLGAVAGLFARSGLSLQFWATILPHGVLELSAVAIAGGAGLLVGRAVLFPGRRSRREALHRFGLLGVKLVLGCIPLLVIAGCIEAFVSPSALPASVKYSVGLLSGVGLAAYLFGAGHGGVRDASPPREEAIR